MFGVRTRISRRIGGDDEGERARPCNEESVRWQVDSHEVEEHKWIGWKHGQHLILFD